MSPQVSDDIESICRKCGDVWHVVVAMVDGKVVKVQCKECGGLHRYRPPAGAAPRASSGRRRSSGGGGRGSRARPTPASAQPLVEVDPTRPVRPYRMTERFAAGDRVAHPTFGEGVVERVVGPQKIQVFFPGGRRVLVHARPAA